MSLDEVRQQIDQLDDQIVALLAQRQQQVIRAASYKTDASQVRAPDRRARMMARLNDRAVAQGVEPEVVARVYTAMIDAFIELELREHRAPGAGPTKTRAPATAATTPSRQRISSGSPYETTIGFSRAVRFDDRVLVSGTGPVWPDGSCPDDAAAQTRRCFEIIAEALASAGAQFSDVVRTRMYLTDALVADVVGAVHGELFAGIRPAATMIIVAGLLDPRWTIEIEAEAITVASIDRSAAAELLGRLHREQNEFYAGDDDDTGLRSLLTDDIVWHVPGTSPIAGDY